jgi:acetolactate synthase-1/2/3 large subunit
MDFQTDQTENVFPMVQAGKGLSEMLLRSDVAAMNQAMLTGE